MKKTAIILALCAIALIAGCGKKKEEEVAITPTPVITQAAEVTVAPTEVPIEDVVVTKEPIKGVPVVETPTPQPTPSPTPAPTLTPTPTPQPTEAPQSATSDYLPASGYYTNGSSGDFRYMNISVIDAGSFSFSIHDGESGETVFRSNVAVFEEPNSTTAVYRGRNYTLYFDCSSYAIISVSGFDGGPAGNTYWNTDILQAG